MNPAERASTHAPLREQMTTMIERLPDGEMPLGDLLDVFGEEGLLLLTIFLTLVFLIPVSIPGVSTAFGAAILLIGLSRLRNKPLWLPQRLRARNIHATKLRPALQRGLVWVQRMERVSRPHRLPGLAEGRGADLVNNLAFILAALLLMAPFGFVPFSNTLPALALLLFAVGFLQRDGGAVLLGHLANIATIVYFAILIGGGGLVVKQLFNRLALA
ncbi:MAG: exopolysaccharide biosynthesis protein [Pseudomonadota bacterium]